MRLLIFEHSFSAGTETVVLQICRALVAAKIPVVLSASNARLKDYQSRGLASSVPCEPLEWPATGWRSLFRMASGRSMRKLFPRLGAWLSEARIRDIIRSRGITHLFTPWIFDVPVPRTKLPLGAMAMDLAWHHFPEGFKDSARSKLDAGFENWLKAADVVFPVSDSSCLEIRERFSAYGQKLQSVPHGATPRRLSQTKPVGLPVFFTPASVTSNKNHLLLLKAVRRLVSEGFKFRLILTGRHTTKLCSSEPFGIETVEAAREFFHEHKEVLSAVVEAPGFVSDEELESYYQTALRVVLPSAYEGFGLPLLEAFERGVPVICSGIAPFREQIARYKMSELATVVDPLNADSLAEAMKQALNSGLRPELSVQDHAQRLNRWTWDHAAAAYVEHLNKIPGR